MLLGYAYINIDIKIRIVLNMAYDLLEYHINKKINKLVEYIQKKKIEIMVAKHHDTELIFYFC